jgi:hypothetical protein
MVMPTSFKMPRAVARTGEICAGEYRDRDIELIVAGMAALDAAGRRAKRGALKLTLLPPETVA